MWWRLATKTCCDEKQQGHAVMKSSKDMLWWKQAAKTCCDENKQQGQAVMKTSNKRHAVVKTSNKDKLWWKQATKDMLWWKQATKTCCDENKQQGHAVVKTSYKAMLWRKLVQKLRSINCWNKFNKCQDIVKVTHVTEFDIINHKRGQRAGTRWQPRASSGGG